MNHYTTSPGASDTVPHPHDTTASNNLHPPNQHQPRSTSPARFAPDFFHKKSTRVDNGYGAIMPTHQRRASHGLADSPDSEYGGASGSPTSFTENCSYDLAGRSFTMSPRATTRSFSNPCLSHHLGSRSSTTLDNNDKDSRGGQETNSPPNATPMTSPIPGVQATRGAGRRSLTDFFFGRHNSSIVEGTAQ